MVIKKSKGFLIMATGFLLISLIFPILGIGMTICLILSWINYVKERKNKTNKNIVKS